MRSVHFPRETRLSGSRNKRWRSVKLETAGSTLPDFSRRRSCVANVELSLALFLSCTGRPRVVLDLSTRKLQASESQSLSLLRRTQKRVSDCFSLGTLLEVPQLGVEGARLTRLEHTRGLRRSRRAEVELSPEKTPNSSDLSSRDV